MDCRANKRQYWLPVSHRSVRKRRGTRELLSVPQCNRDERAGQRGVEKEPVPADAGLPIDLQPTIAAGQGGALAAAVLEPDEHVARLLRRMADAEPAHVPPGEHAQVVRDLKAGTGTDDQVD